MSVHHRNITKGSDTVRIKKIVDIKEEIKESPIELYGNKRVIVFDCKSIINYSEECIVLELDGFRIKITGERLVADSFVFGQTDITGEIKSVEFI